MDRFFTCQKGERTQFGDAGEQQKKKKRYDITPNDKFQKIKIQL